MENTQTGAWLLRCLQHTDDADGIQALAQRTAAEWESIAQLATVWGVSPLLYDRLQHTPVAAANLPPAVQARLRQAYHANTWRNLQIMQQLMTLLKHLNAANIPVIALKGCHLANFVYPALAVRTMSDIDLLVKPADVPTAEKLLQEMGYTLYGEAPLLRWFREKHYHLIFKPQAQGAAIELHWHIYPTEAAYGLAIEDLWQRAPHKTLGSAKLQVLALEDLLLHLCLHTVKHKFSFMGMRAFCDIAEVIHVHGEQLDWAQIEQRAYAWRMERPLFLVLYMTVKLLQAPVPSAVLEHLQPTDFDATLVTTVYEQALANHNLKLSPTFTHLWEEATFPRKIKRIWDAIFWSRAQLADKYGVPAATWRIYLYYPVRVFDIVRHYYTLLWDLLRGKAEATALIERENRLGEWLK